MQACASNLCCQPAMGSTVACLCLSALVSVLVLTVPVVAQTSNCTLQSFDVSDLAGSFEYTANFSQYGTCEPSQITVSLLYLEGDCIKNRDDDSGADCSEEDGTANATSCSTVFADANSGNFVNMANVDSTSYEFTRGIVCGSNASTAYIYVNTTCTDFNLDWIVLSTVEDPDDCNTIKAYNYGAAIGIVVAVVVPLALLVGAWVYWYRRSQSRQGVYEPHHDIHMQPYPEGAAGQAYNDQGYSSSSLPAQQTSSTDRMHPGYPAAGSGQGVVQGTPVYPPWTGGGFKPPGSATPKS